MCGLGDPGIASEDREVHGQEKMGVGVPGNVFTTGYFNEFLSKLSFPDSPWGESA